MWGFLSYPDRERERERLLPSTCYDLLDALDLDFLQGVLNLIALPRSYSPYLQFYLSILFHLSILLLLVRRLGEDIHMFIFIICVFIFFK